MSVLPCALLGAKVTPNVHCLAAREARRRPRRGAAAGRGGTHEPREEARLLRCEVRVRVRVRVTVRIRVRVAVRIRVRVRIKVRVRVRVRVSYGL